MIHEDVTIGSARLIRADCLEALSGLPDRSVDAVLTDPPYSSGTRREGAKSIRKSMLRGTENEEWFPNDCLTTDGFFWLIHANAVQRGPMAPPLLDRRSHPRLY
jgi:site-specific DNA-methyltransferase (adenine-specific)